MGLTTHNIKPTPRLPLTFDTSWDDGWHLDMRIASLLKKYNLPGTFYIVCDWVGTKDYLTWDQIKELDQMGFKIGSHTMSHPADLKMQFDDFLYAEVQSSKGIIENVIGHPISSFCYPRGRYDERVKQAVARAGYTEARTTGPVGLTEVKDTLAKPGTIHVFNGRYESGNWLTSAMQVMDKVAKEGGYVNLWGHSKEVDAHNEWDRLEEFLRYAVPKI